MTDQTRNDDQKDGSSDNAANADAGAAGDTSDGSGPSGEARSARDRMAAGLSRGMEALAGLRESLEDTIHEAREREDLSADRAREMMKDVAGRAKAATSEARDRFDFVTQGEFEDLSRRVAALEARLAERLGGGSDESGGA